MNGPDWLKEKNYGLEQFEGKLEREEKMNRMQYFLARGGVCGSVGKRGKRAGSGEFLPQPNTGQCLSQLRLL